MKKKNLLPFATGSLMCAILLCFFLWAFFNARASRVAIDALSESSPTTPFQSMPVWVGEFDGRFGAYEAMVGEIWYNEKWRSFQVVYLRTKSRDSVVITGVKNGLTQNSWREIRFSDRSPLSFEQTINIDREFDLAVARIRRPENLTKSQME
jgi:hypothetical protein